MHLFWLFAACHKPPPPPPPRPPHVRLSAQPASAVLRVGEHEGTGSIELDLPVGAVEVVVQAEGHRPERLSLQLANDQVVEQVITLQPEVYALSVRSHPPGATFSVGDTTATSGGTLSLPWGKHRIDVSLDGYNAEQHEVVHHKDGSLEVWLDLEGQLLDLVRMVKTGPQPKGVAINPASTEMWVAALDGPPSVVGHDLHTGAVLAELTLPPIGTVEVLFNKDGSRLYASQMETARVREIDPVARKLVRTLETRSVWTKVLELSIDEKRLYAANWSKDDISEIDLDSGEVLRKFSVADTPRGLWLHPEGEWLYVVSYRGKVIERVHLSTGKVEVVWRGGRALRHIVGSPDGSKAYISDMGASVVWEHDVATKKTKRLIGVGQNPNTIDMHPDGKRLFVSNRGRNGRRGWLTRSEERGGVMVVDVTTGKMLDAMVGGNQPTALDVSPDGHWLVFSDFRDDMLRVVRIPTYEEMLAGEGGRAEAYTQDVHLPQVAGEP